MGVHRERLGASKTRKLFGAGVKAAVQKWAVEKYGREIPIAAISPSAIAGVQLLSIRLPPMLEEALGYRGTLRFVEFGYSARTHQFGYCDGGDHIPSASDLWLQFLRHPVIACHLPKSRCPTLYGVFPPNHQRALERYFDEASDRTARLPRPPHSLLLDRKERRVYLCRTDHTTIFFALKEPESEEQHLIFIDGLLMSLGCEDYKVPPPKELAARLLRWLDEQFKLAEDHAAQ